MLVPARTIVGALVLAIVAAGCATGGGGATLRTIAPVGTPTPDFSWQPATTGEHTDISIGIVRPQYALKDIAKTCPERQQCRLTGAELAKQMRIALGNDLKQALVAKGYTVTGVYRELDRMTYGQKKRSNLVLVPIINLQVVQRADRPKRLEWTRKNGQLVLKSYSGGGFGLDDAVTLATGVDFTNLGSRKSKVTGSYLVHGSVTLRLHEPVTGELMWIQEIKIPEISEPFTFYVREEPLPLKGVYQPHVLQEYDGRPVALAAALEKAYKQLYAQFNRYFNTDMIARINRQAMKVREKNVY